MYSLVSGLVKYALKKDEYCVLIIGLDNAGKTTLLEQVFIAYWAVTPLNIYKTELSAPAPLILAICLPFLEHFPLHNFETFYRDLMINC